MKLPLKSLLAGSFAMTVLLFSGCSDDPDSQAKKIPAASQEKLIEAQKDLTKAASIVSSFSMKKPESNQLGGRVSRSNYVEIYPDEYSSISTYSTPDHSVCDTITYYKSDFKTKQIMDEITEEMSRYEISNYSMTTSLFTCLMESKTTVTPTKLGENTTMEMSNGTYKGTVTYFEEDFKLEVSNSKMKMDMNGVALTYYFTFMDNKYSVLANRNISMEDMFSEQNPTDVFFNAPILNRDGAEVGRCEVLNNDEIFFFDFEGNKL